MAEKGNEELEFSFAQGQFEKHTEAYLKGSGHGLRELPRFYFERGKTHISYGVDCINEVFLHFSFELLTKHVRNLRFHAFETGYVVLQDGGDLYRTTESIRDVDKGIRFRFVFLGESHKVEIEKEGDLTQDELQCCIGLFCLFHPSKEKENVDPSRNLERLGARVYLPKEEEEKEKKKEGEKKPVFHGFVGYAKVQEEVLETIVSPLKHPEVFQEVAKATRGQSAQNLARAVLFQGPAGVGKTSLARLIGQATGYPSHLCTRRKYFK